MIVVVSTRFIGPDRAEGGMGEGDGDRTGDTISENG